MKFRLVEAYEPEYDSGGNKLTKEQSEYFKNSKVRDENGHLLVCYHGTSKKFDTFSHEKFGSATDGGMYGDGFYFTDIKEAAEDYNKGYMFKVYLNIENPYYVHTLEEWFKFGEDYGAGIEELLTDKELKKYKNNAISIDTKKVRKKRAENLANILSGHDGVIEDIYNQNGGSLTIDNDDMFVDVGMNQFVVYDSNQIKDINNKYPTASDNINEGA